MTEAFLLALAALWLCGFAVLFRIPCCRSRAQGSLSYPSVSIIIPARNEERNLPILLQSLRAQELQPDEIIVVDDHSDDATGQIAAQAGARVIASQNLPPGWVGKTWACHQAAQQARGDLFIFLDADTRLERDGLRKIMDSWLERRGVMSIAPYHVMEEPYEQLSAFFNILQLAGLAAFTVLGRALKPAGLFGPMLAVQREDYFQAGGHEAVKDKILEVCFLGREFLRMKIDVSCYSGRGALSYRMYPEGLAGLIEGWSKGFASGAARTPPAVMALIAGWIGGGLIAAGWLYVVCLCAPAAADVLLPAAMYACFCGQIYYMLKRIGSFTLWTALLYPLPLAFFIFVFVRSVTLVRRTGAVTWKKRTITISTGNRS
jgi:4,4'-diaponeurosporenoate glycosyltransferase